MVTIIFVCIYSFTDNMINQYMFIYLNGVSKKMKLKVTNKLSNFNSVMIIIAHKLRCTGLHLFFSEKKT